MFNRHHHIKNVVISHGVTHIGDTAFYSCENIESVVIPNSVTHIGDSAFACNDKLEKLIIPDSITHIGKMAFADCPKLTGLVIPKSVIHIGENALLNTGIEETYSEKETVSGKRESSDAVTERDLTSELDLESEVAMIEAIMDEFGEEVMEGSGDFDREAFANFVLLAVPEIKARIEAIIQRFSASYSSVERDKNQKNEGKS